MTNEIVDKQRPAPPRGWAARARLAALRAFGAVLRRRKERQRPEGAPWRLLLIRPDHLGDVMFTTPAVAQLRTALPGAEIWYLCGPWSAPLLQSNPNLDRVITCDFPWFNRQPKALPWAPYLVLWREAARLGALGFDAAVILRFDFWWGAALAALAGIPRRVGYNVAECLPFLTESVPYVLGRHEVVQNLRLCRQLMDGQTPGGGDPPTLQGQSEGGSGDGWTNRRALEFHPSATDATRARVLLGELPKGAGPVVAIHPGAGAAVKLWPPERWAALADALGRRWRAVIVLTGSASERPLTQAIAQHMRRAALDLSGRTSLGELAALLGLCDLVLGVDSGPMHLAVAMDAPTVHLFGPVSPVAFGPWGDPERHVVVQASYAGEPCHGRPCNRLDYSGRDLADHRCMASISLEAALAATERLLNQRVQVQQTPEECREGAEARPGT
jgi:ADP-heptose:LPS heptosyltransferase